MDDRRAYLITRRIKILFDVWDTTTLESQQRVIGREKLSGAPIGSQHEYDPVNLQATGSNGELLIPADAHIRLASASNNGGQRILRRGYSYSEPVEPGSGQLNAGLFFIAFQRSPTRQFIPLQRRLAASDALNRHTLHTSSAIFACPPASSHAASSAKDFLPKRHGHEAGRIAISSMGGSQLGLASVRRSASSCRCERSSRGGAECCRKGVGCCDGGRACRQRRGTTLVRAAGRRLLRVTRCYTDTTAGVSAMNAAVNTWACSAAGRACR